MNMQVIDKELKFPDGVRLMDHPARYTGGVSKLFKRAEQAANVGREISLLYTHAHIRYLEACAKIGDGSTAWNNLFTINPVLIQNSVPNATLRQSNMYFSSSDGMFLDRYDFAENFDKLKKGTVSVKAGWRLYSSGPGIYLNQLVSNILGIRFLENDLIIDPVLPAELDGTSFKYNCFGKDITFRYHIVSNHTKGNESIHDKSTNSHITVMADQTPLAVEEIPNPYRTGGVKINRRLLEANFSEINIFVRLSK
jgi:cellobiose phosphorylase